MLLHFISNSFVVTDFAQFLFTVRQDELIWNLIQAQLALYRNHHSRPSSSPRKLIDKSFQFVDFTLERGQSVGEG